MTSGEFRQLLHSLSPSERKKLADRLGVTTRTIQRWSTYGTQQRDATRSHPELKQLTENETLMGLRGAYAVIMGFANKGSGEVEEDYCFSNWGTACRFAWKVLEGDTDNTFINEAVVSIRVVKLSDGYCVTMLFEASYTESEGWADKIWYWYGTDQEVF